MPGASAQRLTPAIVPEFATTGGSIGSLHSEALLPTEEAVFPLRRGMRGPLIRLLQRRLTWAGLRTERTGYFNLQTRAQVTHLQEKFLRKQTGVVTRSLWDFLRSITRSDGALPWPCTGRAICVSKSQRTLRFVIDGHVERTVDARFGPEGSQYETAEGLFHITWKDVDHISSVYGSAMPFSMFFYDGEAIHYSSNFAQVGYWGNSHGCINIRNWNAIEWIYLRAPVGTRVYVYW